MKKKFLILFSAIIVGLSCLTGCNKQVMDWNYKFDKARVKLGEEWVDLKIKTWADFEDGDQLQLTLTNGTVMLVHSNNCVLYKGTLPEG